MADSFEVSTKVLVDQGQATLRQLESPQLVGALADLAQEGLVASAFTAALKSEVDSLAKLEADQERAKGAYEREAAQDRALAEQGYAWVLRTHAKVRTYINLVPEAASQDLPSRLRFGHLRSAKARGVVYELRILLPELKALAPQLARVGIDDAYLAVAEKLLTDLAADQKETEDARQHRMTLTANVRKGETEVSRLLNQLQAADAAACLANPTRGPAFGLDVLKAELGRLEAERAARVAARATPVTNDE